MRKKKDDSLFGKLFGTVDAVFDTLDATMKQVFGPSKKIRTPKPQPDIRISIGLDKLAALGRGEKLKFYVPVKDLEIEVCLKS